MPGRTPCILIGALRRPGLHLSQRVLLMSFSVILTGKSMNEKGELRLVPISKPTWGQSDLTTSFRLLGTTHICASHST